MVLWEFPKIRGTFLGVPFNKDYSILGSILGFPYFGKVPCVHTCIRRMFVFVFGMDEGAPKQGGEGVKKGALRFP